MDKKKKHQRELCFKKKNNTISLIISKCVSSYINHSDKRFVYPYRLDGMMSDSVLVIRPVGGNLSMKVSMLSIISNSVVGVTTSG